MGKRKHGSRRGRIGRRPKHKNIVCILPTLPQVENSQDGPFESDEFISNCFNIGPRGEEIDAPQHSTGCLDFDDPDFADEYYLILDKPYKHAREDDIEQLKLSKCSLLFTDLKEKCKLLPEINNFSLLPQSKFIRYVQVYDNDYPVVKSCMTITETLTVSIKVHNQDVPKSHDIWRYVPCMCLSIETLRKILEIISQFEVCAGNCDDKFLPLVPPNACIGVANEQDKAGYKDVTSGYPTIRSTYCSLLVKVNRCRGCRLYRGSLRKALFREKTKTISPDINFLKSRIPNNKLTEVQKREKLQQFVHQSSSLAKEVKKLQRKLKLSIKQNGLALSKEQTNDMNQLMVEVDTEMKNSFPDTTSIQRLFWDQQKKFMNLKNKKNMRWHPMIIKWCIYLKSKSSASYDSMRKSGFINLPSERTLHDYSSVLTKDVGFHDDVIIKLQEEMSPYKELHQRIVGLLQDEVKIRSDLVYDKVTGELIGFVDLDSVGNDVLNMSQAIKNEKKPLAKYAIVVMVRGLSTNLKYPLAHFATSGIQSDQLFTVLWEAVQVCEIDVGLTVLFITSDGATPNRRFIKLHRSIDQNNKTVVYRAHNVFTEEDRFIYFISDPPHLIKTARNNISNSYSHRQTRRLWKDGKDISWGHIVALYKDHCCGIYHLCNKLTRNHIDLTSFSYMKVDLAAQTLSSSVANALELKYGNEVTETVKFIRHIDKFFDIMNTRNFNVSKRKLNENVKPFTSVTDERLDYLTNDFLGYFDSWRESVENRPGHFTKSQKAAMQLSFQTLDGLKITVKSVVECIRYCLIEGMPFVLTEKFNQDAIEQHFGMHRARGGCNSNPSLYEFNGSLQKLRLIGSQALAPLRGNTRRRIELEVDHTPLAKKPRKSILI